jgi:Bacterial Ig domain/Secretion system C-terminal sorting domain/PQQ-like domain
MIKKPQHFFICNSFSKIVVIAFLILSVVQPAHAQGWHMQGHDHRRTGYTEVPGPIKPVVKWYLDMTKLQDNASPVVGSDSVVYQKTEKTFFAYNPDSTVKWFGVGAGRAAPALSPDGKTVYTASSNTLYALDSDGGEKQWSYAFTGDISYSSLAVDDKGSVYFGSRYPPSVHSVNPDGTLKWKYTYPDGLGIEGPVAIGPEGNVYAVVYPRALIAMDSSGNFLWEYSEQMLGQIDWHTPSVLSDGTLIFPGSTDEGIIAFNPDGTKKWYRPILSSGYFQGVAISKDESIIYTARRGTIYALDSETGGILWQNEVADHEFDGSLALASNGILYAVENRNNSSIGDYNAMVYAILTIDGSVLWKYQLNSPAAYWGPQSPAIGPDGTLYVASSGKTTSTGIGRLYAFQYTPYDEPLAQINYPADSAYFTAGDSIRVEVSASDADGEVAKVDFYADAIYLGSDTTASDGFMFTWDSIPDGHFKLQVKVCDNDSLKTLSDPVDIFVKPVKPALSVPANFADSIPLNTSLFWSSLSAVPATNHLLLSTSLDFDPSKTDTFLFQNHSQHNFEPGNFDPAIWIYDGDATWQVNDSNSYDGSYAFSPGALVSNFSANASVELHSKTDSGKISFYMKSNCLDPYSFRFYIDGTQMGRWKGEEVWEELSFKIDTGYHEFKWEFAKIVGIASDQNTVWIDNISFPKNICSKQLDGLKQGSNYYWKVNASNPGGTSGWSDTFNFKTCSGYFGELDTSICQGLDYRGYTESGIYWDSLISTNGCDSITQINLTVNPLPAFTLGNDMLISVNEQVTLQPDADFNTYYWSTGDTTKNIDINEPNQGTRSYWLEVTDDKGCTKADTILISVTASNNTDNIMRESFVKIYPNPATELIHLELKESVWIRILDLSGRLVLTQKLEAGHTTIPVDFLLPGIYTIRVKAKNKTIARKLLVE